MIGNLVCFIVLELASGFTQNLSQLLGVRALYGIAMGVSIRPQFLTIIDTDYFRGFWDLLLPLLWKTFLTTPAAFYLVCSNRDTRSATFSLPYSTELLCPLPLKDGEVCSGSALALPS